jgi:glycosyltransferase involved in cell wall biosynthesis
MAELHVSNEPISRLKTQDSRLLTSIIIPTYNRKQWLTEAIDSVLAQQYREFELIIVDDGSDDGTCRSLSRYAGRIHYLYVRHGGVSRARNIGFRFSRGALVAFLDSDDLWQPKKLLRQVEYLRAHPDCRLCYTDEIWIRRGVRVNQGKKHRKYSGDIFEQCLPLCIISPSSALMRRELLEETGGFDESLPVCEDYDLWLRITARTPVAFLPELLIVKRGGHEDQLSRSEWAIDRYRVKVLSRILESGLLAPAQREAAQRELLRKCAILEKGFVKHDRQEELAELRRLTHYWDNEIHEKDEK